MGRITIFAEPDCPDSRKLRTALERRDIPYDEIDLAKYPGRRADMISLTNSLATPQVFFNSKHVGSSKDTRSLLLDWDSEAMYAGYDTSLERYQVEIANEEDPTDDRLRIPSQNDGREENIDDTTATDDNSLGTHQDGRDVAGESEESSVAASLRVHDFEEDREVDGDDDDDDDDDGDDILIPGQTVSALTVTRELVAHLPHSSRISLSSSSKPKSSLVPRLPLPRIHKNCFDGNDAVFALMLLYDISSREEAAKVCNDLQNKRVIHSVAKDSSSRRKITAGKKAKGASFGAPPAQQFEDSGAKLYRLQPFQESNVLNSFRAYKVSKSRKNNLAVQNPIRFVDGLRRLLAAMMLSATDDNGKVELDAIRSSPPFSAFVGATCKLRSVDMMEMTETMRLVFLINLYNIMSLHAVISWDVGKIPQRTFFDRVKYNVGGVILTLNNITNDVLKGTAQTRRFGKLIPKASKDVQKLALSTFDPRVHFALSFGARSCPSVESTYTPEAIDEELRVVTETYFSTAGVEINEETYELVLPAIMGRNRLDFAATTSELPSVVLEYLSKEMQVKLANMIRSKRCIRVKFHEFDWRTNGVQVSPAPAKFGFTADSARSSPRRPSNVPKYVPPGGSGVESWPLSKSAYADVPWDLNSISSSNYNGETNANLDSPEAKPILTTKSKRNRKLRLPFRSSRRLEISPSRSTDNTEPMQHIYSNSSGMSLSLDSGDHPHLECLTPPKPFDAKASMQSFVAKFSNLAAAEFYTLEPEPEIEDTGAEEADADDISYAYSHDVYVVESREFDNFDCEKRAAESLHLPIMESREEEEEEDEEDEEEDELDLEVTVGTDAREFYDEMNGGTFDLPVSLEGGDLTACKQLDFGSDQGHWVEFAEF